MKSDIKSGSTHDLKGDAGSTNNEVTNTDDESISLTNTSVDSG